MIAVCMFLVFEYWMPLKVDPNANKFQFKSLSNSGFVQNTFRLKYSLHLINMSGMCNFHTA